MQILKRDGRIVSFDQDKITNAITKAFISTGVEITPSIKARITKLSNKVTSELSEDQTYSVDDIQNRVEKVLMKSSFPDQAKEYVIYRKHRDELRDSNKYLNKLFNELVSVNAADVDIKRENANINGDTSMAIMLRMGSEANKEFSKKYMMKPEYAYLHDKGIFHEHDQDFYNITFNCCQIPTGKLLKNGFDTGHGFIRTPNSIRTAAALMCIIIQSNQNEMFGGQSVPTFEYDLAPYVVKSFYKHFKDVFEYQFEDYSAEEAIKLAKLIYHENGTLLGYKQLDQFITAVGRIYDVDQYDLNRVLDQAIKLTEDETYQACEAIIHNLNSMHCIPADQRVVTLNMKKMGKYLNDFSEIEQNALKKLLSDLSKKFTVTGITVELNTTPEVIDNLLKTNLECASSITDNYLTYQTKNINDVKKGEYVLSYNINTGEYEYKKVTATAYSGKQRILTATLDNGTQIKATPNHFVLTSEGYNTIGDADDIQTLDGFAKITEKQISEDFDDVYDIEVEDNHNFCIATEESLNVVKNSRAGSQTPFSGINYGTGTTEEQRLIIKDILLATDAGLGNGETPLFPVQIFKVKDGINTKKGDPNFDLFELACKVSAKRLFPNFSFIDSSFNLPYYKPGQPETEIAYMGCVNENSVIAISDNEGGVVLYDYISHFIETYNWQDYKVWDSRVGKFVKIYNVVSNPPTSDWLKVDFSIGETLEVTTDHHFYVHGKGRIVATDLEVGDCVQVSNVDDPNLITYTAVTNIEKLDVTQKSYCLETESDSFDINGVNSGNCRTRVISNVNGPEIVSGRGNFAFNTLDLPMIALETVSELEGADATKTVSIPSADVKNARITKFMEKLHEYANKAFGELTDRFNLISQKHVYNFPFLMGQGVWLGSDNLDPGDTIGEVLKQASLSLGFCGLAECLKVLIGVHHGESEEAQALGLNIIKTMREWTDHETEKTHLNFSLFASPAESTCMTFLRKTRDLYGIIEGVTDRDYFTNSFHVPVYYECSAAKKIQIEGVYHKYCNAGHIGYVEADGDLTKNVKAFEQIILYMKDNDFGYGSINHPVDRCPVCGYTGIIGDTCPKCGRKDGEGVSIERLKSLGITCKC